MDVWKAGDATRRAVLSDEHVDRAAAGATPFTADFQEFITKYAWGEIWTRPGLDRRTRSCITLAMLAALGHEHELAMHVRAARASASPRTRSRNAAADSDLRWCAGGQSGVRGGAGGD